MYKSGIRNYFICAVCAVAVPSIGTGLCASAQTASSNLSFEVATVKPVLRDASHPFDPGHFWAHVSQTRASYWSMSVVDLVTYAYGVEPFQVTSPERTNTDSFDIEAVLPEGANKEDNRKMLQALLKDRFKLAFHIEKRELEGYVLGVGKHGEKLKPSPPDPVKPATDAALKAEESNGGAEHTKPKIITNPDGSSSVDMGERGTQTIKFDQERWARHYERNKMTMAELATGLRSCLGTGDHRVEDQTGIKGYYQVVYDCPLRTPRPTKDSGATDVLPSDPEGGSVLTRSLDALGLALERRKTLTDVYVIDHVERPSEN